MPDPLHPCADGATHAYYGQSSAMLHAHAHFLTCTNLPMLIGDSVRVGSCFGCVAQELLILEHTQQCVDGFPSFWV